MYNKILVPTDGSPGAEHALQAAVGLARLSGAGILALHVVTPPVAEVAYMGLGVIGAPIAADTVAESVAPERDPERDPALLDARRMAEDAGVTLDSRQVIAPQTAKAILDIAQSEHCDLIVMASSGYGNLLSLITGSTTARVVSGCDLPVLVVH